MLRFVRRHVKFECSHSAVLKARCYPREKLGKLFYLDTVLWHSSFMSHSVFVNTYFGYNTYKYFRILTKNKVNLHVGI